MRAGTTLDTTLLARAIDVVHQHRAASVALFQRHLQVDGATAEEILEHIAAETTIVRKMQTGLYLYTHGPIGEELARLNGFAREVLSAVAADRIDPDCVRSAAVRFGLAEEVVVKERCCDECVCATVFEFPVRCVRPTSNL
ncbi:hypothetical protein [Cupriavidus sp. AU9028]|uniref:hypothetical protein n=1 Tax=Cupriavidus sp. AU9028 TaxID=2871157 RepID=UPI001C98CFF3|nr:hypothetical protein [Cupriavidus sp. AU9028]MBY4898675.1 hypothetical protein [Cupriavidus sp. AU9028]